MPSYLVTYEDTSPFFTYSGPWRAGSSSTDSLTDRNSDGTFTVTEAQGASFTFSFFGTEAAIYGSKRITHGRYQVSIDGVTAPLATSFSRDNEFNATLFSGTTPRGMHTVSLVKNDNRTLDIDSVSWVGIVGNDNEALIVNTRQDLHPSFLYSPSNAWTTAPYSVGTYAAGSGHGTSSVGASVQIQFQVRDAIALFGPSGPTGASSYSVSLTNPNRPATTHSANREIYRSRQLLYYGGGLGGGTHTLTMKLETQSAANQMLAVDYAEVYTAPSLGGRFEGDPDPVPGSLIAGFAILGIISLLSSITLVALLVLYRMGRFHFGPSPKQQAQQHNMFANDFQSVNGPNFGVSSVESGNAVGPGVGNSTRDSGMISSSSPFARPTSTMMTRGRFALGLGSGITPRSQVYSAPPVGEDFQTIHRHEQPGTFSSLSHRRNPGMIIDLNTGPGGVHPTRNNSNHSQNSITNHNHPSGVSGGGASSDSSHQQQHQNPSSATALLSHSASPTPPELELSLTTGIPLYPSEDPRLAMYFNTVSLSHSLPGSHETLGGSQELGLGTSSTGATVNSHSHSHTTELPRGDVKKTKPVILQASNPSENEIVQAPPPAYNDGFSGGPRSTGSNPTS